MTAADKNLDTSPASRYAKTCPIDWVIISAHFESVKSVRKVFGFDSSEIEHFRAILANLYPAKNSNAFFGPSHAEEVKTALNRASISSRRSGHD